MITKSRALYRSRAYFLAQAHALPQTITDGTLHIGINEGRIDKVAVKQPDGQACMPGGLLEPFVLALVPKESVVTEFLLEAPLVALNDALPCTVSSRIEPGDRVGYTNFTVELSRIRAP
jgi:hemolysin activation/secretion protein